MELQSLSIDEILDYFCTKANEKNELLENMNTNYKIQLTDIDKGAYYLTFSNNKVAVKTDEVQSVDCTLEIKKKHFISLLKGTLNSTTAFMTGRLKVKGNIGLALKLEQLFKKVNK